MKNSRWSFLFSPYVVMLLITAMYIAKVFAKVGIGNWVNSPVLTGDGLHNLSDIVEAVLVIMSVYISRLPKSDNYPFGRKNVESLMVLAIGLSMFGLTLQIISKSSIGILQFFPEADTWIRGYLELPTYEPLLMGPDYFWWVFGVTAGSVALSGIMGTYQIRVGKERNHPSLIADGQETYSDGRIETTTLVGILSEYYFQAPWIEYILGLGVAALVAKTGCEMFLRGWRALLQRSIGKETEDKIKEIALRVEGVSAVDKLITFSVGSSAICIITVISRARANMIKHIRRTTEDRLSRYLKEASFSGSEIYVRLQMPDPSFYRVAEAITKEDGNLSVAGSLSTATHIRVYDIEREKPVRATDEPITGLTLEDVVKLLKRKRVTTFSIFFEDPTLEQAVVGAGINFHLAPIAKVLADSAF
ncbi:MAG: cation diffusion facilitator family transporter [Candidatus Magasanikbacteria bacterium]|nr:cation diffusion facilitator family transporter [Candidatus Magasanikbacteria bacterium]